MKLNRALEQQIAVFGEAGSGKTVLLSSFYGATQEPQYRQKNVFHVVADDIGQGSRLHRNYLGMRDSSRVPVPTKFAADSYSFSVKLKEGAKAKAFKAKPFDALRLVWHDYPGEWFEQGVSGPTEAQHRVDAFRSLLGSDVAFLLVDAQRLLDNAGEEERYLKSLMANFHNGLLSLKDDLLEDGKPIVDFPRIWVMALSKADLLPDMDVFKFRDLLIEKACDDIDALRKVLAELVDGSEALSVGEDFVLFSSARFNGGGIEVNKRIGIDLIQPLAAMLPFERHAKWAQAKQLPRKVAENLLGGVGVLAAALTGRKLDIPGRMGLLVNLIGPDVLSGAVNLAGDKVREMNADAMAKQEYLSATLTRFRMDLDQAEEDGVLLRSRR
ncbi:ATP/GTP-binding protein [Arthrobacter sp. zg-Y844]|uniref:ATP/GTP-binding protein n=1 Tax=Arthrobacter sp. zg-Y844 TaxID=2964612 RepID=UPI0021035C47|nr:ATP/GTP-binding protein [Arthrobacter sp. zg-Y844]MCQ1987512.1 ATP/GTP-binding protein [Arthrobacter sp. zg-Y844]